MKGNVLVGQSGGPTAVINSSLAGVFKTAKERGYSKVYGMRYGIQGFLDEQYVDLSDHIKNELDLELLKRTPSAFLGTCRYKLPEIHEDKAVYERIFELLDKCEPVIETMKGWQSDISGIRNWWDLPDEAKEYVQRVEQTIGVVIKWISVGPERHSIIRRG